MFIVLRSYQVAVILIVFVWHVVSPNRKLEVYFVM